jgi:hypothetical protein
MDWASPWLEKLRFTGTETALNGLQYHEAAGFILIEIKISGEP